MKHLSKLAYKLYSMGLEKEAARIDDLIKESSKDKDVQENDAKDKKPKRDACYYKVKSRFEKWPSAYGSGALVRCRQVGAKNWGEGGKKKKKKSKKKK
jgi:hypothetical protein